MNQFFQFVVSHWELWLLFLGIIALLIVNEYLTKVHGVPQLVANDVVNLMNRDNAVIVDLRDSGNFSAGHVVGAINIPRSDIASQTDQFKNFQNKPIVLICTQGQHAMGSAKLLRKAGVESVNILKGGMTAWNNASLPLKKGIK